MENRPKATRRGGRYCVAGAPNGVSCKNTSYTPGIRMYQFPSKPSVKQQWVDFVRKHRPDFVRKDPERLKYASLCSSHFEEKCFTRRLIRTDEGPVSIGNRVLIPGSVPTRDCVTEPENEDMSQRTRRQVSECCYSVKAKLKVAPFSSFTKTRTSAIARMVYKFRGILNFAEIFSYTM